MSSPEFDAEFDSLFADLVTKYVREVTYTLDIALGWHVLLVCVVGDIEIVTTAVDRSASKALGDALDQLAVEIGLHAPSVHA